MSTTVEENARDAPVWSSRAVLSPQTIVTVLEKLQSALQKSRIDRATTRPTADGRAGVEHWDGAVRCVSVETTQCCLAVWSRWVESSTRLGGFRALKKTTEAPYTTKVNNR